jgi:glucokinase
MTGWRIVCDVGGTHIRIARSDGPRHFSHLTIEATEHCHSLPEAIRRYWLKFDDCSFLQSALIAAAGPVEADGITLTNGHLTIERGAVSIAVEERPVVLLNDLEATAYAVPLLTARDLSPVVTVANPAAGPRLVVNVGTGFGAALSIETATGWQSVATEAGHMTLGGLSQTGANEFHASDGISVEDRLSGFALRGDRNQSRGDGRFPLSFGDLFGAVCGNLVLATGAWGGVYLCGGVASAWCRTAEFAVFTKAFRMKGRMTDRMGRVPVNEIVLPHPALMGLTTLRPL